MFLLASCRADFLHKQKIEKMSHHKISKAVKEIFDFYVSINKPKLATKGARIFDDRQSLMIREKFLVQNVEKNYLGLYVIYIGIAPKNQPQQIKTWKLVLQDSEYEESGYEIIKFYEYNFISKYGKEWPFYKEYEKYWL